MDYKKPAQSTLSGRLSAIRPICGPLEAYFKRQKDMPKGTSPRFFLIELKFNGHIADFVFRDSSQAVSRLFETYYLDELMGKINAGVL